MKRWIALALFMIPLLVSAQSFWEGSAALQRGDATFESSLSAVSNSFPPGTRVLIQNLETGQSTEATVSQRSSSQSDILILLSPKAADAVGIQQGSISRVRVTVLEKPASPAATGSSELAYNPDPDINPGGTYRERETRTAQAANPATEQPAATQQTPQETAQATEQPATEQPQTTEQTQPTDQTQAAAQQQTTPQVTQPVQDAAAAAASAAAAARAAEDQKILADAAARQPQKQLFLPPREDEKFAWHPAPQTPAQAEQPQVAQAQTPQTTATPETPSVIGESGGPGASQQNVPLAEAQPGSASTPQEVAGGPGQPAAGENGAQLVLPESTPEGIQPSATEASGAQASTPEQGAQPALTAPEAPAGEVAVTPTSPAAGPAQIAAVPANPKAAEKSGQVQTVATLPKLTGKKKAATFYLQLGAYETQEVAMTMAGRLPQAYPVLVLTPPADGKQTFKVLVGPLNKAESGTLLPLFKFRGFRDAFIRAE